MKAASAPVTDPGQQAPDKDQSHRTLLEELATAAGTRFGRLGSYLGKALSHKSESGDAAQAGRDKAGGSGKGSKRLLLIEGKGPTNLVLLEAVRKTGLQVDTAPNERVGLEKLRKDPPDAILIELMAGVAAIESRDFIREVRRNSKFSRRPIYVFFSRNSNAKSGEDTTVEGATKVFNKHTTSAEQVARDLATELLGIDPGQVQDTLNTAAEPAGQSVNSSKEMVSEPCKDPKPLTPPSVPAESATRPIGNPSEWKPASQMSHPKPEFKETISDPAASSNIQGLSAQADGTSVLLLDETLRSDQNQPPPVPSAAPPTSAAAPQDHGREVLVDRLVQNEMEIHRLRSRLEREMEGRKKAEQDLANLTAASAHPEKRPEQGTLEAQSARNSPAAESPTQKRSQEQTAAPVKSEPNAPDPERAVKSPSQPAVPAKPEPASGEGPDACAGRPDPGEAQRRVREGVASLARVTADLENERGERRRIEHRAASLAAQLRGLHEQLGQHLESERVHQNRIAALEQRSRDTENALAKVQADFQKEANERQLAEDQLRVMREPGARLQENLGLLEEAKKSFNGIQQDLESRLQANLSALRESEATMQKQTGERIRLAESLAALERASQEQSRQSAADVARLQSALQLEGVERKRLEAELLRHRYLAMDSARASRTELNRLRQQMRQPVGDVRQIACRLLQAELTEEQKKLAETILENALLLETSLQEAGPSNGAHGTAEGSD